MILQQQKKTFGNEEDMLCVSMRRVAEMRIKSVKTLFKFKTVMCESGILLVQKS